MYPNSIMDGIDASIYQGTINWSLYEKRYGFVILKCSTTMSNGSIEIAENFLKNYKEAKETGVRNIGVYHYSIATTEKLAIQEGEVTLQSLEKAGIKPGDLTMGVWYDMEDKNKVRPLGRNILEKIFKSYKLILNMKGFPVGIYTNKDWLTYTWDINFFKNDVKAPVWMAQYYHAMTYSKPELIDIWQKSSTYRDTAITNKEMDYNILYTPIKDLFREQQIFVGEVSHPVPDNDTIIEWVPVADKWKAKIAGKYVKDVLITDGLAESFYIRDDGFMIDNEWFKLNEKWYRAKCGGYLYKEEFFIDSEERSYYFGKDCIMSTGYELIDGKWYYFCPFTFYPDPSNNTFYFKEGEMLHSGVFRVKDKQLYFNEKGQVEISKTLRFSADSDGYLTLIRN